MGSPQVLHAYVRMHSRGVQGISCQSIHLEMTTSGLVFLVHIRLRAVMFSFGFLCQVLWVSKKLPPSSCWWWVGQSHLQCFNCQARVQNLHENNVAPGVWKEPVLSAVRMYRPSPLQKTKTKHWIKYIKLGLSSSASYSGERHCMNYAPF